MEGIRNFKGVGGGGSRPQEILGRGKEVCSKFIYRGVQIFDVLKKDKKGTA